MKDRVTSRLVNGQSKDINWTLVYETSSEDHLDPNESK